MALGWSGSNGGITQNYKSISAKNLRQDYAQQMCSYPLEVSYFVNNICNLKCRHCYVGYKNENNSLTVEQWEQVFDECIAIGALTFGNVGKEPTLSWEKSVALLQYLKEKRRQKSKIRFGLVTNAILLNKEKSKELSEINPDYLDISLDGTKEINDTIRGHGSYAKVINNIKLFPRDLLNNVFISFTANQLNLRAIPELIDEIYKIGVKNILISPYVSNHIAGNIKEDDLYVKEDNIVIEIEKLLNGELINFDRYDDLNIYVKTDFTSFSSLMQKFVDKKIIDRNNLKIDEYGVIFTKYTFNSNNIYFNYLPWDNSFTQAIRISHDGFIGNCYDMLFRDYSDKAIGNVKNNSVIQILKSTRSKIERKNK
ncbi:MAG: radical SAM protein [Candidatus Pacebacteria bacterium]|nr:radical SAM protein [Candidatus Paceibacterota bacterium]